VGQLRLINKTEAITSKVKEWESWKTVGDEKARDMRQMARGIPPGVHNPPGTWFPVVSVQ
jgi:hypothetical protein